MISSIKHEIKRYYSQPKYRQVVENFIFLSILKALVYILPLISFPYIVRVVGVEKFGLISFAQALITYFQIITDFGFNLSATRKISIYREEKEKIQEIFSSVMIIRFALMMLSLIFLVGLVVTVKKLKSDWFIYLLSFGMVAGNAIFPVWFFQGMEKMKYITFLNVMAKSIFTFAIFIFVTKEGDYWKIPLLNSIGTIVAGIWSFAIVVKKFKVQFIVPTLLKIKEELYESFPLFLSIFSIPFFNQLNILALGFFCSNREVGYYSLAAQIVGIIVSTQEPIVNAIFPMVSKELKLNFKKTLQELFKVLKLGIALYILIALVVVLFGKKIIALVFTQNLINSYEPLIIMIFVPCIVFIANIYGNQILINMGKYKIFSIALIVTGVVNMMIIFPLVYFANIYGAAVARVFSETFLLSFLYFHAKRVIQNTI